MHHIKLCWTFIAFVSPLLQQINMFKSSFGIFIYISITRNWMFIWRAQLNCYGVITGYILLLLLGINCSENCFRGFLCIYLCSTIGVLMNLVTWKIFVEIAGDTYKVVAVKLNSFIKSDWSQNKHCLSAVLEVCYIDFGRQCSKRKLYIDRSFAVHIILIGILLFTS